MISIIFTALMATGGIAYHSFASPSAFYISPPQAVINGADPVLDTTGKIEVECGQMASRTGVIVVIGQSLSVNEVPTAYTPISDNVDQINIYDGKCYKAQDPLLGINVSGGAVTEKRGTWISRMADKLVAQGKFDRVVIVPMAVGATTVAQWADSNNPPYLKNNINVVALRLAKAKLACTAIMWGQGESDTGAGTSKASYQSSLQSVIAEFNRAMPACPILVAQESYYYGATSTAILEAQSAVVNGSTVFAGENVDTIPPSGRYDNTHLNEVGADQRASIAAQALLTALGI